MKCGGEGTRPVPMTVVDESYGIVAGGVDVELAGGAVETVVVAEGCVVVGTTVVEVVVVV